MLRRLAPALVLPVLLAACGGAEPESNDDPARAVPLSGRQETSDGVASLVLPKGWVKTGFELDGKVTFASVDALDPNRQIFVTTGKSRDDAEAEAVFVADAYTKQKAACASEDADTTYGGTYFVLDCVWEAKNPYRKVMVVLGDETRGAMLLVGGNGQTRADLADLISPILKSWRWEK